MQLPTVPPIHVTVVSPERPWYADWNLWVSIGTLIVAAMTGWYAYETRKLRKGSDKAMADLSKHAEHAATASKESAEAAKASAGALGIQAQNTVKALEVAERNATAAEKSANTASESITLAKDSMRVSLRAYVTVEAILPVNQSGQIPSEIGITVINTGQTPARHLEVLYRVVVLEEVPESFSLYADQYRTWMATDVGKDQRRTVFGRFFGRDELLAKVQEISMKLIVHGGIRYNDMFSDEQRMTEFCFVWDVRLQAFFPIGPANNLN